jgi:hypothetical protein
MFSRCFLTAAHALILRFHYGIGERMEQRLNRAGIFTVEDLVDRINRRYGRCTTGLACSRPRCASSKAMPLSGECRRGGSFSPQGPGFFLQELPNVISLLSALAEAQLY